MAATGDGQPLLAAPGQQTLDPPQTETDLPGLTVAQSVRPHMKLGISYHAAVKFIAKEIKPPVDCCCCCCLYWRALATFRQNKSDESWVKEEYPHRITCYDIIFAVRKWLKDRGAEDRSVCEELLRMNWPGVGEAEVFISHTQSEDPTNTMETMRMVNEKKILGTRFCCRLCGPVCVGGCGCGRDVYQWVDIFSLRQCKSDFSTGEVAALIKTIKHTVCVLDMPLTYAESMTYQKRLFCIFEAYSTMEEKDATLTVLFNKGSCYQNFQVSCLGCSVGPCCRKAFVQISASEATCRSAGDQQMIKDFIERRVGYQKLDQELERKLMGEIRKDCCCTILQCFEQSFYDILTQTIWNGCQVCCGSCVHACYSMCGCEDS